MVLYDRNSNTVLDVEVDDSSYRYRTIMGDNKLFLYFSLPAPLNLPLFSWCTFKGEKYFLMKSENFRKVNTENHEFMLELDTCREYLKTQKFEFFTSSRYGEQTGINSDREIEFSLTLSPREYVQLLVDNMNLKDSDKGWSVGECIDSEPVLLDFNDMYCRDVLNMLADAFKTEWEIEGKTIHLGKVEKLKNSPLPLQYGQDKGILSGLERTNYEERTGAVRVKTSDRNIDGSTYGSRTLKMPKNHSIIYEGTEYYTDSTGSVITRRFPLLNTPIVPEATLDLTRIYPKRTGTVSGVTAVDDEGGLYDFTDKDNPVNYSDYIIAGQEMTVVFQTGSVAGIEMQANYHHDEKRFELVPLTQNGIVYPQSPYIPSVGDTYAVFNVSLPGEYIDRAETEVLNEAVKYLHENENPRYTYGATLDELFSKRRWLEIGGYFNPGYYIRLSEPQYLPEPVDIRIVSVKDYVNRPYSPEITLSDSVQGVSVSSELKQVRNVEQTIKRESGNASRLSNVRWRDLTELYEQLHALLELGFTEGIKPVAVNAMMAYFGAESLQYRFVNRKTDPITEVDMRYDMDNAAQTFTINAGIIQHMTIGIDTAKPEQSATAYKFWDVAALPATYVGDRGFLWIYIKASKSSSAATFVLSETEIEAESVAGYYHFLCGTLSSAFEGERTFQPWYGFSVITPGQLRIPKIASTDGTQYWDMLNKRFFIGDGNSSLSFNDNGDNKLVLKGTLIQSESGVVQPVDVFRGAFVSTIVYYKGDLVTYAGSTYRYKYDTPYSGRYPTSTTYWEIYAQKGDDGDNGADGSPGTPGRGYMHIYFSSASNNAPAIPTAPNPTSTVPGLPAGWDSSPTFWYNDKYLFHSQSIQTNGLWGAWSLPTLFGIKPDDGKPGPSIVFRGDYNSIPEAERVFYNNANRRDVVKYNNQFWLWNYTDATIHDKWDEPRWESFGAQFSSVATDLLLALNANVGGWKFRNERLESQSGGAFLDGVNGKAEFTSNVSKYTPTGEVSSVKQTIKLDSVSGEISARSDTDTAYVTSQGIFSNRAGIRAIPAVTGIELKAAVVGLGNGNLEKPAYGGVGAICGVYGRADNKNSNPAPAWGGYFEKLLANGLYLSVRQIRGTTTLTSTDCYVAAYNSSNASVYLPPNPQTGMVIIIRRMNSYAVTVYGNGKSIHNDGNTVSSISAGAAQGDCAIFIYDGQYWSFNYWIR